LIVILDKDTGIYSLRDCSQAITVHKK